MERIIRDKRAIALFIFPAMLVYMAIVFVPIIWSTIYSFYEGVPGISLSFNSYNNYIKLFNDKLFINSVVVTLKYTTVVVIGQITLGLLASFAFKFFFKKDPSLPRTLVFLPVIIPTVAVGQLFSKIYEIVPQYGLLNAILDAVGMDFLIRPWIGDSSTALLALCMQDIWRGIGFYALMFYSAIIDINEELFDSSKVDGANAFALIRYIILPMIKPIIAVATVYSLNGTLKALETALALTKGGPGYATMLTNIYMFNVSFNYREYGYGSAIAVFLLIQCLLLTMLVKRLFSGDVDT